MKAPKLIFQFRYPDGRGVLHDCFQTDLESLRKIVEYEFEDTGFFKQRLSISQLKSK